MGMTESVVGTKRRFSETGDVVEPVIIKKNKTEEVTTSEIVSVIDNDTGLSKCFHRVRAKMYLSLAPIHLEHPIEGLRQQHLDPLVMTYNPTIEGVIISYNNVKLSNENLNNDEDSKIEYKYLAKVANETPFTFLWVYVDFIIWRPKIGDYLEGYSVIQSQSHIGLLIHDVFNASIKKFYIPQDWYFVPNQADENEMEIDNETSNLNENNDQSSSATSLAPKSNNSFKKLGYWCDGNGVAIDGKIKFTVRALHVNGKGLAVEGTLLTPGMEKDSQPVVMEDNIKDNIKKHMKFDDDNNNESSNDVVVENIEETELPEIQPLTTDDAVIPQYKESDDSDSDNNNDKGSSSDSDSDSDDDSKSSSEKDSDSDSD